jgi:pimeloyl-ACP methyl ester carboxylesterase
LARPERTDVVGWPTLRSLTLCNGAVHIDLAKLSWPQVVLRHPTFGPMLGRLGSKSFMGRRLRKTLANPAGFRDDDIDFLWSCYGGWGRAVLAFISGYMAGEIPGARLQWLEGVAHYPMVEAPEVWAASVLGFFTGLDSMARA